MKSLRRLKDQDGKAEGDDKVSLMSLALVLCNIMAIMSLKLMKGSIRKNNQKEMQKTTVGVGREDDKVQPALSNSVTVCPVVLYNNQDSLTRDSTGRSPQHDLWQVDGGDMVQWKPKGKGQGHSVSL